MEFYPSCYNIAFIGKENKIWKTTDGGSNFKLLHEFGENENDQIKYIEISRSNPEVMYCNQSIADTYSGKLWKTTDSGITWESMILPDVNTRRMLLTLDPLNENNLWIAFPSSGNGKKIYKTIDGGLNWENLSTDIINNEEAHSIIEIGGTDGGVYYCTNYTVYYRNNTMDDWENVASGLPVFFNSNIARPFYRDGKLRIASYGKGIWESNLVEESSVIIPQPMVDKFNLNVICKSDSFYFDDYSIANHKGLKWKWEFPDGSPMESEIRNPTVFFESEGDHIAIMTLTDSLGNIYRDSLLVNVKFFEPALVLDEGFESGELSQGWFIESEENGGSWSIYDVGGYGNSDFSAFYNNFDFDAGGNSSDLRVKTKLKKNTESTLFFDVAYAQYGYPYTDSLEVLISLDCGLSFDSLYRKGGKDLQTHSSLQDGFYPSENDWRTDTIILPTFDEETEVVFAFRNFGHWGNNLFLDNINVNGISVETYEPDLGNIAIYPNPVGCDDFFNLKTDGDQYNVIIYDIKGNKIYNQIIDKEINTIKLPEGIKSGQYIINIEGKYIISNRKLIVLGE